MELTVSEMFTSVQGEGRLTGRPCFFIRTFGCNRECQWCDTSQTTARRLTLGQIASAVPKYIEDVVITGGEPLLQRASVYSLAKSLIFKANKQVHLETNGELLFAFDSQHYTSVTISPKPPSSGRACQRFTIMQALDLASVEENVFVKIVIADALDYRWLQDNLRAHTSPVPLYLQPCWNTLSPKELLKMYHENPIPQVTFSFQVHKLIGEK